MRIVAGLLFLTGLLAVASISAAQPPGGGRGGQPGKGFPGGKGGGFGGVAPMQPGQVMPAFLADRLKLTEGQKKEVETLQKEVDEKLAKILTEDQSKQLKEMKERVRGGFGRKDGERGPPGKFGGKGPPPPPEE